MMKQLCDKCQLSKDLYPGFLANCLPLLNINDTNPTDGLVIAHYTEQMLRSSLIGATESYLHVSYKPSSENNPDIGKLILPRISNYRNINNNGILK